MESLRIMNVKLVFLQCGLVKRLQAYVIILGMTDSEYGFYLDNPSIYMHPTQIRIKEIYTPLLRLTCFGQLLMILPSMVVEEALQDAYTTKTATAVRRPNQPLPLTRRTHL